MRNYRQLGPQGLDAYITKFGPAASPGLDAVCAQRDAHTALLYWFTDLGAAIVEARRTRKPILSLRLLGRLDEELSCANSRFFRKLLYPDAQINQILRNDFVLHWQSVRAVPRVTIDFGGGKTIERTLTGNSVHLVLDPTGRPVDALPGLFARGVFVEQLRQAASFGRADRRALARMHADVRATSSPGSSPPGYPPFAPQPPPPFGLPLPPPPRSSRADRASRIAPTKHMVEGPLLRNLTFEPDADTEQNLALHDRIHEAFAAGAEWAGLDGFVEWIYAELFAMPLGDPALGLDVPDPFSVVAMPYRAMA